MVKVTGYGYDSRGTFTRVKLGKTYRIYDGTPRLVQTHDGRDISEAEALRVLEELRKNVTGFT